MLRLRADDLEQVSQELLEVAQRWANNQRPAGDEQARQVVVNLLTIPVGEVAV